jgi:hypothetical protein
MATPGNVRRKAVDMMREGYDKSVAFAAAHDMRRRHKLGPKGQYRRVGRRKRGPRGRQRAGSRRASARRSD